MDPLAGCWAKIDRAKEHVETIRGRVLDTLHEDPVPIPLTRKYDDERRVIAYSVESVPETPQGLGVIIGDALHNFRSALDHLWWQLAIRHLKREPTKEEARNIQFPIISDSAYRDDPQKWTNHRFLRHVNHTHVAGVEAIQPYNRIDANEHPALEVLREFSNTDKHQIVHVALGAAHQATFRIPSPAMCTDCVLDPRKPDGIHSTFITHNVPETPLRAGNEIFFVYVRPTGKNPDVDLDASLTGTVVIGSENLRLTQTLDAIGTQVTGIVHAFDPLP